MFAISGENLTLRLRSMAFKAMLRQVNLFYDLFLLMLGGVYYITIILLSNLSMALHYIFLGGYYTSNIWG